MYATILDLYKSGWSTGEVMPFLNPTKTGCVGLKKNVEIRKRDWVSLCRSYAVRKPIRTSCVGFKKNR